MGLFAWMGLFLCPRRLSTRLLMAADSQLRLQTPTDSALVGSPMTLTISPEISFDAMLIKRPGGQVLHLVGSEYDVWVNRSGPRD